VVAGAVAAGDWTCPMHPEVRSDGPGDCPICGMALERVSAGLDDGPNQELVDMRRRFRVAAVLSVPLVAMVMVPMVLGRALPGSVAPWLELALSTPVVWWAGWPFFVRGAKSVVSRHLNMFTLVSLGVGAAWLYSVVAVLAPGLFPSGMRAMDGRGGTYFEGAAGGITRQINNVAAGTADSDAANVAQLKALEDKLGAGQNASFGQLDGRIRDVGKRADAAAASAIAQSSIPQATKAGASGIGVGTGVYGGQSAIAVGFSSVSQSENWVFKGNVSANSKGRFGAGAGALYQW